MFRVLESLVLEIDRQAEALSEERRDEAGGGNQGLLTLQEQGDTYRQDLAELRRRVLSAFCRLIHTFFLLTIGRFYLCILARIDTAYRVSPLENPVLLPSGLEVCLA